MNVSRLERPLLFMIGLICSLNTLNNTCFARETSQTSTASLINSTLSDSRNDRPNIVFLLIDDLGRADCGFMGGTDIQTPNIDTLARQGCILESHYVQPVCSPTRAALMTGRYATQTGVYTVVRPNAPWGLPLNETLLPQVLKESGYRTAICGKWHLGDYQPDYRPTRRGFDHQYGHLFGAIDYFTHTRDGKDDWYRDDVPLTEQGYSTELIAQEASRIIRTTTADKPLFLYVPFNGIHTPMQVPDKYREPYKQLTKPRQTIAAMLSAVDDAIGQITQALDETGLRKNTIIVFSSDNGGPNPGRATMNTPLRAGKGTIYEGGVRVCAFAVWPDVIPAGTRTTEPIHAVDWFPTLCQAAGATINPDLKLDGLNILPVLKDAAPSPHDAILLVGNHPQRAAIRMGNWKLLMNASDRTFDDSVNEPESAQISTYELYDLNADIGETTNRAAEEPELVMQMSLRLKQLLMNAVPPGEPATRRRQDQ